MYVCMSELYEDYFSHVLELVYLMEPKKENAANKAANSKLQI